MRSLGSIRCFVGVAKGLKGIQRSRKGRCWLRFESPGSLTANHPRSFRGRCYGAAGISKPLISFQQFKLNCRF